MSFNPRPRRDWIPAFDRNDVFVMTVLLRNPPTHQSASEYAAGLSVT